MLIVKRAQVKRDTSAEQMASLRLDDVELVYDAAGDGEPLLLLHGVGSDRRTWRPQMETFARTQLAVAFDFRGHGESRAPASSISLERFAADSAALIDALGAGPAHLCGLSMGAIVALELWRVRPDLVLSLALADAWAHHPAATASLGARLAAIDATPLPELARERMRAVLAPDADSELLERSTAAMAAKDVACYRRSNEVLWGADMRDVAATVTVPTLVLVGELDRVTPPGLSRELAALIPGSRLVVIPGAGHLSNEENSTAFNAALTAHLSPPV